MNAANARTFDPKVVLGMVLFGALAFLAMLWFIGAGETGRGDNNGGGHAAARGLNGFAALAGLVEDEGITVTLGRNTGKHETADLLVLTPPHALDPEDLRAILDARRYAGPTMVVLPKWYASEVPPEANADAEPGWVVLAGASEPTWLAELGDPYPKVAEVGEISGSGPHWRGLGYSGRLPDPGSVQSLGSGALVPLVLDRNGRILAGYLADDGYYPVLDQAAGRSPPDTESLDEEKWGVIVVAEPDLLNNWGMADRTRANLARDLVWLAMEGEELGVTFDLTLNGIGQTRNLLTLAFTPPFLAATLCLLLAMLVVGWRAFRRFGPPIAEDRAIAFGKARLVANSAGFIQRAGRVHLLGPPFAALVAARIARLLRLRQADERSIDEALERRQRGGPTFSASADRLRAARSRHELLRAARALKDIERNLTP
ncbi:DUF4350 domain-containing protein [Altererythrobacter sp. H2]|uniref:DUF4350 domain-containing protein n=1 Tax=Altererythrobacter sp. H2 TaxID=3108391 RepID=UPI002B4C149E|nr:DUF4350 domain-containing protein [Altererythrobacter sp. H2]WRK95720.1 DUF4350 domain-containing protein [Altererythrobacter sp. H2]